LNRRRGTVSANCVEGRYTVIGLHVEPLIVAISNLCSSPIKDAGVNYKVKHISLGVRFQLTNSFKNSRRGPRVVERFEVYSLNHSGWSLFAYCMRLLWRIQKLDQCYLICNGCVSPDQSWSELPRTVERESICLCLCE